jgi:6-phosphogluconolactonase
MPHYVYVSISEEDRIALLTMDAATGALEPVDSFEAGGRPAPLAISPQRQFLYAGRRDALQISSYRIDQGSGRLSPIGSAPVDSDPCYLATDRNGRFLLSAYYSAAKAAVHRIGEDGAVETPPVESRKTAPGAHSMQTDPSNRFAFVPHIAGGNGPNRIYQFNFDENTGRLTPNATPMVIPAEEAGPRHYCFHPSRDMLYFSNEQDCSVTAYDFDSGAGTLTALQTISTLPEGYEGVNHCSQIQITPSGRFLYAPNRGHDSIACFTVDPSTGLLTSIGQVPSETVPRAFSIDPTGNFLYAAGLETGRLASYRIDGGTGELEPLEVYDVGKGPLWVLATTIGE